MADDFSRVVELARGGDREAFAELYTQLAPRLYNYFFHHLRGQETTAEDLAEDVFLILMRRLDSYAERGLPFTAWVFRIAHNRLIDHYRSQRRRGQVSLDAAREAADWVPETELGRVLDRQVLMGALDGLTPDQRNVIVLRFLQRLSLSETALALEKSEDGVKKLQQRGLDALRRALSGGARQLVAVS